MKRRRHEKSNEMPGQDSFLDVIANLVGILIILVVVISAQATTSWSKAAAARKVGVDLSHLRNETEALEESAIKVKRENVELENNLAVAKEESERAARERNRIQLVVASLEQKVSSKVTSSAVLDEQNTSQLKQLVYLASELKKVERQVSATKTEKQTKKQIDHLPTPIARTVFGEEIHFRLENGRIAHLPMDELTKLVRKDFLTKSRNLNNGGESTQTVGPIGEFRIRYQMVREKKKVRTESGIAQRDVANVRLLTFLPVKSEIGEPIERIFEKGSAFRNIMDSQIGKNATVSIWVYPDSFDEFNKIKKWLAERRILTAAWPLPFGQPVTGSPSGDYSSAQ